MSLQWLNTEIPLKFDRNRQHEMESIPPALPQASGGSLSSFPISWEREALSECDIFPSWSMSMGLLQHFFQAAVSGWNAVGQLLPSHLPTSLLSLSTMGA